MTRIEFWVGVGVGVLAYWLWLRYQSKRAAS